MRNTHTVGSLRLFLWAKWYHLTSIKLERGLCNSFEPLAWITRLQSPTTQDDFQLRFTTWKTASSSVNSHFESYFWHRGDKRGYSFRLMTLKDSLSYVLGSELIHTQYIAWNDWCCTCTYKWNECKAGGTPNVTSSLEAAESIFIGSLWCSCDAVLVRNTRSRGGVAAEFYQYRLKPVLLKLWPQTHSFLSYPFFFFDLA